MQIAWRYNKAQKGIRCSLRSTKRICEFGELVVTVFQFKRCIFYFAFKLSTFPPINAPFLSSSTSYVFLTLAHGQLENWSDLRRLKKKTETNARTSQERPGSFLHCCHLHVLGSTVQLRPLNLYLACSRTYLWILMALVQSSRYATRRAHRSRPCAIASTGTNQALQQVDARDQGCIVVSLPSYEGSHQNTSTAQRNYEQTFNWQHLVSLDS